MTLMRRSRFRFRFENWRFRPGHYTKELEGKDPALAHRIDRALNVSWKEGSVTQLMVGAFDYYLIPYALSLGATTPEIGLLISVPFLIAASSQLFAVRAVQLAGSRCDLLTRGTAVQALFMIPLGILPVLAVPQKILLLTILVTVFRFMANLLGPAWGSLMSDYLPENKRGEYFGWRSRVIGVFGVIGIGLWGILLSGFHQISTGAGFMVVFLSAAVLRFVSYYYMRSMTDIEMTHTPRGHFDVFAFYRQLRQSNFAKFVLYVASITFATQMSVPYFSVYLLKEAGLDYLSFMGVQMSSAVMMLVTFPLWGKQADMVGNAKILKLTSFFIPLIPVLWFLGKYPIHFMLAEGFSGFMWAGFNLCATNFVFDSVPPSRRVRVLGYYNLINSVATFLGAWFGGHLAEVLPPVRGSSILTLFLLSALIRFLANFILSRKFTEVRAGTKKIRSTRLILSVLGIRPLAGRNVEAP